jgi:hypothetical protein
VPSYTDTSIQTVVDSLGAAGFDTRVEMLESSVPWILAENAYFLVGVVVTESFAQVEAVEPEAVLALLRRIERGSAESKVWDAYLLLTCPDVLRTADEVESAAAVSQSLRGVRRLVAAEVTGPSDMRRALAPFLPLPKPAAEFEVSALEALRVELVVNGVPEVDAMRYVEAFRDEGSLKDV